MELRDLNKKGMKNGMMIFMIISKEISIIEFILKYK